MVLKQHGQRHPSNIKSNCDSNLPLRNKIKWKKWNSYQMYFYYFSLVLRFLLKIEHQKIRKSSKNLWLVEREREPASLSSLLSPLPILPPRLSFLFSSSFSFLCLLTSLLFYFHCLYFLIFSFIAMVSFCLYICSHIYREYYLYL